MKLFENKENKIWIEDNKYRLKLIYKYICAIEKMVENKKCDDRGHTFENSCYKIARSIIEYSKSSYDNLLLGHINTSCNIDRVIIENYVFLHIIMHYKEQELWKYWIAYSYNHACDKFGKAREIPKNIMAYTAFLQNELNFDNEFLTNGFIEKRYGWTYKVNKNFSFKGLCDLINKHCYEDFKYTSDYVHETSIVYKETPISKYDEVVSIISVLFVQLKQFAELYCADELSKNYLEIEEMFYETFLGIIND